MQYFVSGIGTEVGKTVVSAILVEYLQADYWKPVQAGDLHHTDSMKIEAWISNEKTTIHPEGFRLNTPASPHYAAAVDGVHISLDDFELPATDNDLIVEGAGGLMVPLNEEDLMIDLMAKMGLPVILVSRNYLGSINHTLLSIEVLQKRNIPIAGIIFNGEKTPSTESVIEKWSGVPIIGNIPELETVNQASIKALVEKRQLRFP